MKERGAGAKPRTVEEIADLLGQRPNHLWDCARRAHTNGYRPFVLTINAKKRIITAPRTWLKTLQRRLYDAVLIRYPVSEHVFSARGHDVVENAEQHLDKSHMVVLDIADCFPSTSHHAVNAAFAREGLISPADTLLTRLVTYKGVLPQGPPSSPAILNIVLSPVDQELAALALTYGARYTRYMDDLCFSADEPLHHLARAAEVALARHRYSVNAKKKRIWGPNDKHTVTKIVVAASLNPNHDYLKALVSAIASLGHGRSGISTDELRGRVAWVERLNPTLGAELRAVLRESARSVMAPRLKLE